MHNYQLFILKKMKQKLYNFKTHLSLLKGWGLILLLWLSFGTTNAQNNALEFDGTDDVVTAPSLNWTPTTFSVEFWIKPNNTINYNQTIRAANNWDAFVFSTTNTGAVYVGITTGSRFTPTQIPAGTIEIGVWQHIAFTFDGTNGRFYKNGVQIGGAKAMPNSIAWGGFELGSTLDPNNHVDGSLDEVRVWNTARTCQQINTNKDNGLIGNEAGLIAYYNFNQGTAAGANAGVTTLNDLTANNHDGTLTNFTLTGTASNWITSTNGVTGTTPLNLAEINVQGNSVSIVDGDITPNLADNTNFGSVSPNRTITYTIQNTVANSNLTVANIGVSGANASDFVVSNFTNNTIIAGVAAITFDVTFTPAVAGIREATITINNSDCNETAYNFSVQGSLSVPSLGNNALDFDGGTHYVEIPSLTWTPTTFTVEFWIKPNNTINYNQTIRGSNGVNGWGTFVFSTTNTGAVYVGTDVATRLTPTDIPAGTIEIGVWQHIAFTHDGTNGRFYKDGVQIGATKPMTLSAPWGGFYMGYSNPLSTIDGALDEVRIWNTTRTCEQINLNKDNELVGNEANLEAYYNFNQGVAAGTNAGVTTLTDLTTNNYDGTLTNFSLAGASSNWIASTNGVTGTTPSNLPNINVQGNGISIVDGDITPTAADDTDFGSVTPSRTITYTIQNTIANSNLTVANIGVSGLHASDFVVSNFTNNTIIAGNTTTTFDITFTPSELGNREATITINNSDCDATAYDFAIQGSSSGPIPINNALDFDGTDDVVTVPSLTWTPTTFSVEFWIKPNNTINYNQTIRAANNWDAFVFSTTNTGAVYVGITTGSRFTPTQIPAGTIEIGVWQHIAFTFDGTNGRFYKNGVQIGGAKAMPNSIAWGGFELGNTLLPANHINGSLDEVRIWNTARTCNQINLNKDNGLVGNEANLIAYYNFNQGTAAGANVGITQLTDLTANNHNGTLTNFTLTGATSNWITSTNEVNGTTPSNLPNVNVEGNGISIADGDITPNIADNTDFGSITVSKTVTYTIQNTVGNSKLTIGNIDISGLHAADFMVSNFTNNTTVAGNTTTTFNVTFTPSELGNRTATITINNNDCNNSNYNFAIQGSSSGPIPLTIICPQDMVLSTVAGTCESAAIKYYPRIIGGAGNYNAPITGYTYLGVAANGHSYYLSDGSADYLTARQAALDAGGYLAVIDDATENTLITSYVTGAGLAYLLIGYDDIDNEGTFEWYTGQPTIYTNWRAGEPNDAGGNEDATTLQDNGGWNDLPDNVGHRYIVEVPNASTIQTSGLPTCSKFPIGVTTNTFITTDILGNTSTCSFTVTVTDGKNINILGNDVSITDGDITPTIADDTDFGIVSVDKTITYTIDNTTGIEAINITSITSNNVEFAVSNAPTTVLAGGTATFDVTFTPTDYQEQIATIIVNSNSCDASSYDFQVKAKQAFPIPPLPAPPIPNNFQATAVSTTQINLTWQAINQNITEYRLYQNSVLIATLPITASSYEATGLNPDSFYSFTLIAVNQRIGTIKLSSPVSDNEWTFPEAPTVLSIATICENGNAPIRLSSSAFYYNVYESMTATTPLMTSDGNDYFTLPFVTETTTFYVSVIGKDPINLKESARIPVTVNVQAPFEANIIGETNRVSCDATLVLEADSVENATYTWFLNGSSIGATGQTITVNHSGNYKVRIQKDFCTFTSQEVLVRLNAKPTAQIQQPNGIRFCDNGTLSAAQNNQNATYKWILNDVVIGEEANVSISQSGIYTLEVTQNGCPATAQVEAFVLTTPQLPVLETNQATVCPNEETTISVQNIENGVTYSWYRNGRNLRHTGNSFSTSIKGDYHVLAQRNENASCTMWSDELEITRLTPTQIYLRVSQDKKSIFLEDILGTQDQIASIEWYFEGESNSNLGTNSQITPAEDGYYSAIITNQNGCKIQTRTVYFIVPKVVTGEDDTTPDTFGIYPNPSKGIFNIRFAASLTNDMQVSIFDATGKVIQKQIFEKNNQKFVIDIQGLSKGIYLIRFNQKGSVYSKSIILE